VLVVAADDTHCTAKITRSQPRRPRAENCRSGGVTGVTPRRYSLGQRDGVSLMSPE
jgi:hypothetical protein